MATVMMIVDSGSRRKMGRSCEISNACSRVKRDMSWWFVWLRFVLYFYCAMLQCRTVWACPVHGVPVYLDTWVPIWQAGTYPSTQAAADAHAPRWRWG